MIIAIGGVSTAGKTTLAGHLRNYFQQKKTSILCQDDFVKPVELIPLINNRINWEHPDSIDHIRFKDAIEAEKRENDVVIVEGLMVFWHPLTQPLLDKKIFIEIDYSLFRKRKNIDYRWGDEPDWYIEHIWKSYMQFGLPINKNGVLFVNGNKRLVLNQIISYLEQ
jgi:nicotinamide/nicotinate riboside kinase